MHILMVSSIKYNISLEKLCIFKNVHLYISKVSVPWTSTQYYQCTLKSWVLCYMNLYIIVCMIDNILLIVLEAFIFLYTHTTLYILKIMSCG